MSAAGPVAILAGGGALPMLLADRLAAAGRPARILAFRGFADRALRARADAVVGLLDIRRITACLESWSPGCVTMAGGLRRPDMSALLDTFATFRDRAEVAAILGRGDDNLLRAATELLEERGFPVLGIRDLAPELLAGPGTYGAVHPSTGAEGEIALGLRLLDALSAYDMGQAVAIRGSRVLAAEGPEGTDLMLARCRGSRLATLLGTAPHRSGVLVKAPKRGQDLRVDLPAIGPRTVAKAARAGLSGIAVAEGVTLVLDREATVAAADRLGLFVAGVAPLGAAAG